MINAFRKVAMALAGWLLRILAGPKPGHPRDKPKNDAGPPPTGPR